LTKPKYEFNIKMDLYYPVNRANEFRENKY